MEDEEIPTIFDQAALYEEMDDEKETPIKGLFDLLGYLPEELEEMKVCVGRLDTALATEGVDEYLRAAGREFDGYERDAFAIGIMFGEKIQRLLKDRSSG